jgi:hypothetical protein
VDDDPLELVAAAEVEIPDVLMCEVGSKLSDGGVAERLVKPDTRFQTPAVQKDGVR